MPRRSAPREDPPKAILDLNNIIVTLGNAAVDNDEHDALPGYRHSTLDRSKVGCWVPAIAGDRFCIHVGYEGKSLPYPNAGLYFEVYLDGVGPLIWSFINSQTMVDRINQVKGRKPITIGDVEINGRDLPNGIVQPFRFSLRQTVETGDGIPPQNIGDFGKIYVVVYWAVDHAHLDIKERSPSPDNRRVEEELALLHKPVNEKLKPVEHRCIAAVGKAEDDPDIDRRLKLKSASFEVKEEENFGFCFKYRDIAWLEIKGIAPRRTESARPAKRRKVTYVDAK